MVARRVPLEELGDHWCAFRVRFDDLLPIDTLDLLEKERGEFIELDKTSKLDWAPVRESIKTFIHSLRSGESFSPGLEEAATIATYLQAAIQSSANGRKVAVSKD